MPEDKVDTTAERAPEQASRDTDARGSTTKRVGSNELLGPNGQLIIAHRGEDYRLRITSKRKLLLTK